MIEFRNTKFKTCVEGEFMSILRLGLFGLLPFLMVACTSHHHERFPPLPAPQLLTFESDASGFNTKTFFYDNGEEVVAIDSQFTPELARQAIAFLKTKSKNPITHLIITHPNPDKFNGIGEFKKVGAKVVVSLATADAMEGVHNYKKNYFVQSKMFTDETYPALQMPDVTFDKALNLTLRAGDVLELKELRRPGVSSNQTVVYMPKIKALVVGDLVHHKAHAWLEGGIVKGVAKPTIKGWISDLKSLKKKYPKDTQVYGGRGETAELATAVSDEINYLKKMDALVADYVKELGKRKNELKSENAKAHYEEIQKRAEAAFPDYKLGYMVQYGVYGLVNSKL